MSATGGMTQAAASETADQVEDPCAQGCAPGGIIAVSATEDECTECGRRGPARYTDESDTCPDCGQNPCAY